MIENHPRLRRPPDLSFAFLPETSVSCDEIFHYPKHRLNPIAFLDEPCMMFRQAGDAPVLWCKKNSLGQPWFAPMQMPAHLQPDQKRLQAIQKVSVRKWNVFP